MHMTNPYCGVEREPRGVVRLTICNAGSLNILGSAAIGGLREGLETLAADRGIRALIIDKDRRPRWERSIDNVTPEWIGQTFLSPLSAGQDPLDNLESSVRNPDAKTWS